ncbi:MAG: chloride channel protein [Bdellovibrionales bacterium]|nr:chloride channel protein [Bdellovibrionales bacterium]
MRTLRNQKSLSQYARWICLSGLCGVLAGTAAAVFLLSLDWATRFRVAHPELIWALPLGGLFVGLIYHHFGKDISAGNNLILDEIHDPKRILPFRMAPFVLLGTLVTHFFGGSAGREGTAVQMGASLSDQLTRFFRIGPEERKVLLTAGAGAGFGAAIGAPWAGVIFGMEVLNVGRLKLFAWFECLVASFVGFHTAKILHAPHSVYPSIQVPGWELRTFAFLAPAGIVFGLAAKAFAASTHVVERSVNRWISYPPFKPFLGGLLVAVLFYLEGSYRYAGLGIPYIQEALTKAASFKEPLLKSVFTSLTLGPGFKGGEFVPLVFIGTTLGSALSMILPVSSTLLAAVGFAAVFGAAANTPLACTLMAMEIFGGRIAPFAFVGCLVSYYFSGHHGIYKSQRVYMKKHHRLLWWLGWLGELPRRFLNGNGGGRG